MRTGGMLDAREFGKRIRRFLDGNYSYRKILLLIIIFCGILLYFGPTFAQWLFSSTSEHIEVFEDHCINERLVGFYFDAAEYNANVLHNPPEQKDIKYLPYIGNGAFGIPVTSDGWIYIKHGRSLLLPVMWKPLIVHVPTEGAVYREATVTHFTSGIVHKYQCLRDGYHVDFQYYAHRGLDGLLMQDLKIANPSPFFREVSLELQPSQWHKAQIESVKLQVDGIVHDYNIVSGYVKVPDGNKVVAVSIAYKTVPKSVQIKARSSIRLEFLTGIQYSEPLTSEQQYPDEREVTKRKVIDLIKKGLSRQQRGLKDEHVNLWQSYWNTGLRISDSKAEGAINGHKINSTMYYVLSQVSHGVLDVEKNVAKNEGCYRGHHTLDAPRLWKDTSTIEGVNEIVQAWLVTLEKQGCHHLMTGGPAAVQQALVLSLGGLKFNNQDLEFNIDPQYLHRDYLFRRISYGNMTHLNISVKVGDDNRAILGVALDKSDSVYFGCDAGCLDAPVPLTQSYTNFPVKLTKPLTAILYITSDHQHMQELRNALHVHEVDDAPAHDHHVMALHKHGHQLGGLPTFFWVSICFLIVVFHLFLCKLILSEYHGHQDRQRVRYNKL
ncbi:uncharacterized protein KIAA2013 homolog [Prorops nasuta]|uniref:uncharacterized protein KIAA2013 homolog n=1 Tax=Prorops nasuta TaxID=863751 RepID=UPI0034CE12DC